MVNSIKNENNRGWSMCLLRLFPSQLPRLSFAPPPLMLALSIRRSQLRGAERDASEREIRRMDSLAAKVTAREARREARLAAVLGAVQWRSLRVWRSPRVVCLVSSRLPFGAW